MTFLVLRTSPVAHRLRGAEADLLTWCGQNTATQGFFKENAKVVADAPPGFRPCKNCARMFARGSHARDRNEDKTRAWRELNPTQAPHP